MPRQCKSSFPKHKRNEANKAQGLRRDGSAIVGQLAWLSLAALMSVSFADEAECLLNSRSRMGMTAQLWQSGPITWRVCEA